MDTHLPNPCCPDANACATGLRNNYFRGKKLTPHSFQVEQRYLVGRRQLLNRAIHGWGVVYGFRLQLEAGRLSIGAGLALDRPGRELLQEPEVRLGANDLLALDEKGNLLDTDKCGGIDPRGTHWGDPKGRCFLLRAHYAERPVGPLELSDPCSCKRDEWDSACETVRYSLEPVNCGACCVPSGCELECACGKGPCCGGSDPVARPVPTDPKRDPRAGYLALQEPMPVSRDSGVEPLQDLGGYVKVDGLHAPLARADDAMHARGGCRCLCDYATRRHPDAPCEAFRWVEEACGRVRVDLRDGVPLGCLRLERRDCEWVIASIEDDCGPRRLVKNNDMLFDLIQGCDLTRIDFVGWQRWHRRTMAYGDFRESFGTAKGGDHSVSPYYWIQFSRGVRRSTVRPDAFEMTVVVADRQGGWGKPRRVPIVDVFTEPNAPADGLVRVATIVVDQDWVAQHLGGNQPDFTHCCEIHVEIRVHCDYLVDCNGQRVDGSVPGLHAAPTGRTGSGRDLFSSFAVTPPNESNCRPYVRRAIEQGVKP